MLEQLLSILLTSHYLGGSGLSLQKNSPFLKGIFPGTRLGLHRMCVYQIFTKKLFLKFSFISHQDRSKKTNTHYSLGDLGIIPPDNTIEKTIFN